MKVSYTYPPNFEAITKAIPAVGRMIPGVVFTYGNTIYYPRGNNNPISDDLMKHETRHSIEQAKTSPDEWWAEYLVNKQFRFDQELLAYRDQYEVLRTYAKKQYKFLMNHICKDLSGPMYGSLCSKLDARHKIMA